jgi:hypothetical protein
MYTEPNLVYEFPHTSYPSTQIMRNNTYLHYLTSGRGVNLPWAILRFSSTRGGRRRLLRNVWGKDRGWSRVSEIITAVG